MPVTRITRWTGGTRDDVIAAIRKSKPFAGKFGGELEANEIHDGPYAGQWLTWQRFPDMASYERAEQSYANDAEYKQVMSEALAPFQIVERFVVFGIDVD